MVTARGLSLTIQPILLLLVGLATASHAHAGLISELFMAGPAPGGTMPHAVELDGLPTGPAAASHVDLVLVDASPRFPGRVLQVIQVPTTTASVRLISDSPWPDTLWAGEQDASANRITLAAIAGPAAFNFNGARTLHLYDRPTGLVPQVALSDGYQQAVLRASGAQLLDTLTFALDGASVDPAAGPAALLQSGQALARPADHSGQVIATPLVGAPGIRGVMLGVTPTYVLTPGAQNHAWQPPHTPEPASLTVLLAALLTLPHRPRRHV